MMRQLSLAAAALTFGTAALAQDKTAQIDRIFSFATAETPGCAVGVSQNGTVIANRSYGLANVERRVPLSQSSLFDIGSTQKQFTAAAVLLLANDGRLSLSDDIRKHLPELPDYGHTVTINHWLTHTGGIRDWTGLLPMADEGTGVLQLLLRQRGLNFVPGEEWSYSSSGFELAKEIVARVSGMSFGEFARTRLFAPLGMRSSAYVPDIMQAGSNAAMGYQKDGDSWKPFMRLGNNRGGGAIVSTVSDLVRWTDALASGKLGKSVTDRLHERTRLNNGRTLQYARGLIIDNSPGGLVISHSGGAAGFSTWMGRVPEHNLSVAVSCNFDPVSATNLAGRVIDNVYLPPADSAALARWRATRPVAAAGVDVSAREGLYFDERTGEPMRLTVTNGRLVVANGPPLVPVSATTFRIMRPVTFFRSEDDFVMTFTESGDIEFKSMEGQVTRYRRAQPYTVTPADMQGVEGRYQSAELGSVFEIIPGTNVVSMRFESAPDKSLELTPVARDTWMYRMMIVRFRRDAGGKVEGFVYGNPIVRGIRFARIGNRNATAQPAAAPARPAATPTAPAVAAAPAVRLEGLAGDYEIAPGRYLGVTLENGKLFGQPPQGQQRQLTHVSGTTFSVAGAGITLVFNVGTNGRATSVLMRQGGREQVLPRF